MINDELLSTYIFVYIYKKSPTVDHCFVNNIEIIDQDSLKFIIIR